MSELISRIGSPAEGQAALVENPEHTAWKLVEQLTKQIQEGVLLCERNDEGGLRRVLLVNEVICQLTQYSEADYLAMNEERLASHTRIALTPLEMQMINSGQELRFSRKWKTRTKEKLPLIIKASPVEMEGSHLLLLVVQDRSEEEKLKKMAASAEERDRRYRSMLKVSPEPILFHSEEVIIYANDAALQLLGAKWERELLGRSILDFIHKEDKVKAEESIRSLQYDQPSTSFKEFRMIKLDGKPIELEISSIAVFQYMKRPVIQSVLRDVTERKNRERLERQSDKLLAVSQLAAGLAHEIRNPLTAMKGFLQLMKSKSGEHQAYVDIMLTELERIHYTIGEFMMLARPSEAKNLKKNPVNKLIQEVMVVMEPQAVTEKVELICHVDPDVPDIHCDGRQIKQVFVNVVKNAIEAMSAEGGRLWINASLTDDSMVRVKFIDTGAGIEPEAMPRLGEPFFTTKDYGNGLGLMVSNQILEMHGGKMNLQSEKNVGTTVWIDLPIQIQKI